MTFHDRPPTRGPGFRTHPHLDDWSVVLQTRPNMLIIGPGAAVDAFIGAVTPHLLGPVRSLVCPDLPSNLPGDGTLILRSVDSLDPNQQQRLARLLDEPRGSHTQLICITTTPLYLMVQAGMFLDRLYYRLNVVHFEVIVE